MKDLQIWHFAILGALLLGTVVAEDELAHRKGNVFPLFNVVQFENGGCRSTSKLSSSGSGGEYRNGTCYTKNECESKGGMVSGTCAASFGVCCVFLVESGTVRENCTYIRNKGFTTAYTETTAVSYTINKCDDNVCSFRLDFETFNTLGVASTEEINGGVCVDQMTTQVSSGQVVPVVCGANTGQHMYLDVGRDSGASATVAFAFTGASTTRMWEIKVTQIPCGASYAPPSRCLQYHTGLTGTVTSFNWLGTGTSASHLANQKYSSCIRQEEGYCCVRYQACPEAMAFTISEEALAVQDTGCSLDYVGIEGSSDVCDHTNQANLNFRYCGTFFSKRAKDVQNRYLCDCTSPFSVDVHFDALTEKGDTTTANKIQSKGFCLTYMQLPCN